MDAVEIRVDGQNDLIELDQWLRGDRTLRGQVRLTQRSPGPGEMGGVFDAIAVAVGAGGAATVMVKSLFAWLELRAKGISVTLRLKSDDGKSADVTINGVRDADRVLHEVIEFFAEE